MIWAKDSGFRLLGLLGSRALVFDVYRFADRNVYERQQKNPGPMTSKYPGDHDASKRHKSGPRDIWKLPKRAVPRRRLEESSGLLFRGVSSQ